MVVGGGRYDAAGHLSFEHPDMQTPGTVMHATEPLIFGAKMLTSLLYDLNTDKYTEFIVSLFSSHCISLYITTLAL